MEIQKLRIEDLKPYEKNAKLHPQEQIDQIKKSIEEFGMNDPIAIWGKDNIIVEGHGRLLALKQLGYKEVDCIRLDHLTDEERKAYTLAHNKLTMNSDFDFDILEQELSEFETIDMSEFGFDIDLDIEEEKEVEEDDFEVEVPEEPKAKLGDIYQLGNHRLMCGDSTSIDDVEKLMNGNKADMVFTDPPYGYSYKSNHQDKFEVLENDDKILNFFPQIKNNCDGFVYVCTMWKKSEEWINLFKKYFELTNVLIWNKGGGSMGDLYKTFADDYEMILVANNNKEILGKRYGSIWDFTKEDINNMKKVELINLINNQKKYSSIWDEKKDNTTQYVHPTQKPISLSAKAIRSSCETNQNVLDLFGGSGSTLMACEQLNRNCYMMELDPKYVDVIINRWEQYTGKKAILIETNNSSSN